MTSLSSPHLGQWYADAEYVTDAAQALLRGLSPGQLTWKPAPKEWSIAECFDHLVVVNNLYYPRIEAAIANAREQRLSENKIFRPSLFGRLFINSMRPNAPIKARTFKIFEPSAAADEAIQHTFIDQQATLLGLIQQADGLDLNTAKVFSPLTNFIKFSLGEALWLLVVHEQNHLQQAQNVRASSDFPQP